MMSRFVKSLILAAVMGWSVYDLSGHLPLAILASMLPLALGLSNVMPFAAVALPMLLLMAAMTGRVWADFGFDVGQVLSENASTVRDIVVANLPAKPN